MTYRSLDLLRSGDGFGCISNIQLHNFCDPSQDAYGDVSYVRIVDENGFVHAFAFLLGKYHLAPIRQITIPRLELLGAILVVRMHATLKYEIRISFSQTCFRLATRDTLTEYVNIMYSIWLIDSGKDGRNNISRYYSCDKMDPVGKELG